MLSSSSSCSTAGGDVTRSIRRRPREISSSPTKFFYSAGVRLNVHFKYTSNKSDQPQPKITNYGYALHGKHDEFELGDLNVQTKLEDLDENLENLVLRQTFISLTVTVMTILSIRHSLLTVYVYTVWLMRTLVIKRRIKRKERRLWEELTLKQLGEGSLPLQSEPSLKHQQVQRRKGKENANK